MSDPTENPEPVDPEAPDPTTGDTGEEPQEDTERPSNREARYRRQLRDTEAERDTIAGQLEAMRRGEVERLAGQTIAQGSALWATGIQLEDLLDDSGTVDAAAVADAAKQASETLGLAPHRGNHVPREGSNVDARHTAPSFEQAFAPNPG